MKTPKKKAIVNRINGYIDSFINDVELNRKNPNTLYILQQILKPEEFISKLKGHAKK